MRLISHIVFIDLDDNRKLLLNSLNGLMDEINMDAFAVLKRWEKLERIEPIGKEEVALYNTLLSRGYLVVCLEEEAATKKRILGILRENHSKIKASRNHLTFVMTYDCNFRCPYCFEKGQNVKKEVISFEQINSALELAGEELQSIGLFGGEPFQPSARLSLEYLLSKTPDKTYWVITNGYFLSENFDLLSKMNLYYVLVTLDGREDIHDARRFKAGGQPTFKKIMLGIEECLDGGIPIRIRMNVDGSNFEDCNDLKEELWKKFGHFENFLGFEISPMIGAANEEKTSLILKLHALDMRYAPEERIRRNMHASQHIPIINALITKTKSRPTYSFCYAHDNGFVVDPFGEIYPCLAVVGNRALAMGKYHPYIEFKENSIRNRSIDNILECRSCKYSLLCGGGCPASLKDHRDMYKPACSFVKHQIHNLLPRLYELERADKSEAETEV